MIVVYQLLKNILFSIVLIGIFHCISSILLPTSYNSFSTDDFQNKEEFKIPDFTTEIVNVDDSLLCDEEDIDDDLYSYLFIGINNRRIAIIKSLPPYDSLSSSLLKHNLLPDRQSTACEYTMVQFDMNLINRY